MRLIATVAAAGVLASSAPLVAGCGHSGASHAAGPCGTSVGVAAPHGPRGVAAAMLSARIVVAAGAPSHRCLPLRTGSTVNLRPGDRVEFLANGRPMLTPTPSRAVRVSTTPAVLGPGPGSPHGNLGVLVRITAVASGSVTARWIDCSGTAC